MNCRELEDALPKLLAESVPDELRMEAEAHTAGCPRCRSLLDAARGNVGHEAESGPGHGNGSEAASDLTRRILRRTSGSVCERIEERLVDWVDEVGRRGREGDPADSRKDRPAGRGVPPEAEAIANPREEDPFEVEHALILEHLGHCPECLALTAALQTLQEELPAFRDLQPDARFVEDVLERTSRMRQRAGLPWARRWLGELRLRARGLARRPRFAQELAYVAALALFLIVGSPSTWVEREAGVGRVSAVAGGVEQTERALQALTGFLTEWVRVGGLPPAPAPIRRALPQVRETASRCGQTLDLGSRFVEEAGRGFLRADMVGVYNSFQRFKTEIRGCWGEKNENPAPPFESEPSPPDARTGGHEQPPLSR